MLEVGPGMMYGESVELGLGVVDILYGALSMIIPSLNFHMPT